MDPMQKVSAFHVASKTFMNMYAWLITPLEVHACGQLLLVGTLCYVAHILLLPFH